MNLNADRDQHVQSAQPTESAPITPEVVPELPATNAGSLEGIRQILLDLVPEAGAKIEWEDALGNVYRALGVLPARRQTILLEMIRNEAEPLRQAFAGIASGDGFQSLLLLVTDPKILGALEKAYMALHAETVAIAAQRARDAGFEVPREPAAGDLFPAEEMLRATVPFFARPVAVLLGLGAQKADEKSR